MQRASVCTMHPAARPGMQSHEEASLTARVFPDVYGMLGRQLQVPTMRRTTYGRQRVYGQGHADVLPLTRQASRSDILSREGRSHLALLSRYTPRVDRPVSQREQSDHHAIAASLARILPRKTSRQHSVPEAS